MIAQVVVVTEPLTVAPVPEAHLVEVPVACLDSVEGCQFEVVMPFGLWLVVGIVALVLTGFESLVQVLAQLGCLVVAVTWLEL